MLGDIAIAHKSFVNKMGTPNSGFQPKTLKSFELGISLTYRDQPKPRARVATDIFLIPIPRCDGVIGSPAMPVWRLITCWRLRKPFLIPDCVRERGFDIVGRGNADEIGTPLFW